MGIPLTAVILAAGQGRRLEPVSLTHSKAMTPIIGIPITELVVQRLRGIGFERFVLVIGGDDDDLAALAEGLRKRGVSIDTAVQAERLGTAHALMQARSLIDQDFLLASCDNLYPESCMRDMAETFLESRPPAVVASFKIGPGDLGRCAGVRLDRDCILEIVEKPGEGTGPWDAVAKFFFIFNKSILEHLDRISPSPRGEYEVQSALQKLLAESTQPAKSVFVHDFLHLTTADDLIRIHRHYLSNHTPFSINEDARVERGVEIIQPVMVDAGAQVQAGARLGPYVYIGRQAQIGSGAVVEESIIYANAIVPKGSKIKNEIVLP